jgi:transposase
VFRQSFSEALRDALGEGAIARAIRVFSEDESRFGLLPLRKRRITGKGVKPVGAVQHRFESFYVYGAVEPKTGESFFLELPWLNAQNFQVFLDEFSSMYRDTLNIIVLDNGRFHKAGALKIPENVVCVFLPPYSPELNPIERLWQDMKCDMAWKLFGNIEEQQNYVAMVLNTYDAQKIHSLTSYPYFVHAANALCS